MTQIIDQYITHVDERAALGIPPRPLGEEQTEEVCRLLQEPAGDLAGLLMTLLTHRVPPGVDPAAKIKADFLGAVAQGQVTSPMVSRKDAANLLGTMLGGYNVPHLIRLLEDEGLAPVATEGLSRTVMVFDAFHEILSLAKQGLQAAKDVLRSWAEGQWFTRNPCLPESIRVTVFKVDGEINTDDFSPARHAPSRPDIPLHALAMGETRFPGGLEEISRLQKKGLPVAFVGDVVGTGSSRKSACNSLLWHIGNEIPHVPNKKRGGVILGGVIAPIFFNTAEDSGAYPITCDVASMCTGQEVEIRPHDGQILDEDGALMTTFQQKPLNILDEVRAGGRVPLIIGRQLTDKARDALGLPPTDLFVNTPAVEKQGVGFSLAQKIVGRACDLPGVHPGTSCLPKTATVASQDTTGPMTADEIEELACLNFQADLVMQSFCHTAAYPTETDKKMHQTLPPFMTSRGGVALKPGDGVVHSWINRLILPDTFGTGGDSHTRFPVGLSFPSGSGLVAFAAALGSMPVEMPESVLVRLQGELRPGITLRDVVGAIPLEAIRQGLLTVEKKGKKNIFNGRVLEMEGLPELSVEQAFELTDASAERSAAGSTMALTADSVARFLSANVVLLDDLLAAGYEDQETLRRRKAAMEDWLASPSLLARDENAEYAATLEIDLGAIEEPILACPNDPDDVQVLSQVAGRKVDEVFIGSCMVNLHHFRAAAEILEGRELGVSRLWLTPPTRMDWNQLATEGALDIFQELGARLEIPGCSLCMGNQARVADGSTVVSTSTRNFDNRMGTGAQVFLASAELAAVTAILGRIPRVEEYFEMVG